MSMSWQGERGPDGPNGDKGERGDDVSDETPENAREISFVIFDRLYYLNPYMYVCVFQGEPGGDGARGERVNDYISFKWVTPAEMCANVYTTLFRGKLEKTASKGPVETEAQGERR